MKKIVVSASSLPAGRNMSSQIEYLARVGNFGADIYHFDVMDGTYTKNKSADYTYIPQLKEGSTLLFDCHLMVNEPSKVIKKYAKAGANILTVQYEVFLEKKDLIKTLKKIKKLGMMAGLAVDLNTDIVEVDKFIKYVDLVLIMSVKAGKGGQAFDKSAIKKIKHVRQMNPNVLIEVDGGINDITGAKCVSAGADILVSGNYIYNNDTYEAIQGLKGKNG